MNFEPFINDVIYKLFFNVLCCPVGWGSEYNDWTSAEAWDSDFVDRSPKHIV